MSIAFIALGSNLGNRMENLDKAIEAIRAKCKLLAISSIHETMPMYYTKQPKFLNMAIKINTTFSPIELLNFLQSIEKKLGRKRTKKLRFGPRTIDLDILIYRTRNTKSSNPYGCKIKTKKLTIPHPRMLERLFVLLPLYEIEKKYWIKQIIKSYDIS